MQAMSHRTKRVTMAPERFVVEAPSKQPPLTPEEQVMREQLRLFSQQVQMNDENIKEQARRYTCRLLCAEQGVEYPRATNSRDALLATQMTQVGVADDGYEYDFQALRRYINRNMGTRLVSPITKQPMLAKIYHAETVKGKLKAVEFRPMLSWD